MNTEHGYCWEGTFAWLRISGSFDISGNLDWEVDGTDYISRVEKKSNRGFSNACASVHTSKHKHMYSDVLSDPR